MKNLSNTKILFNVLGLSQPAFTRSKTTVATTEQYEKKFVQI